MNGRLLSGLCRGKNYLLYLSAEEKHPLPLIFCHVGQDAESIFIQMDPLLRTAVPFALCAVPDVSWDRDYTPWPSDCMQERAFSGGADSYLDFMEQTLLPHLSEQIQPDGRLFSLGYSLGGLCALYSLTRNALYSGGASVSGALWYPGFQAYFSARRPDYPIYCSLGRAERKTRHPMMGNCLSCTQAVLGHPGDLFEWNNGNHFFEIPQRLAKAVRFLLVTE